jgi:hypothetical protein
MFAPMIAASYPYKKIWYPLTQRGLKHIVEWLFPNNVSTIMEEYDNPNADTMFDEIITDGVFLCSNRYTARQVERHGTGKSYLVDWQAAFSGLMRQALGAVHAESGAHIFYYSQNGDMWSSSTWEANPEQRDLAVWLNCVTARLVHCGDPSGCTTNIELPACVDAKGLTNFPSLQPYSSSTDERLVLQSTHSYFGSPSSWGNNTQFSKKQRHRCDFWDTVKFSYVNTFYNDGTQTDPNCNGESSIEGSEHWWHCSEGSHSCGQQCCCDKGTRSRGGSAGSHGKYCEACITLSSKLDEIFV